MLKPRTLALTALAMIAFAGNSLLCRAALKHSGIDAASFTSLRLVSGAAMLWLLVRVQHGGKAGAHGNWPAAAALFAYAAAFSFAYLSLSTGTGALLLFGAVQATMIGHGLWKGERLTRGQGIGLVLALGGLLGLLLPGLTAPPLKGALLMLGAGVAWGVYSLLGRGARHPTQITAGNFLRALPFAIVLAVLQFGHLRLDAAGFAYAVASGAIASGLGYSLWYAALPGMKAAQAASVQLSVPVLAAIGGAMLLGEALSLRLMLASAAILGGIALVILERRGR